MNIIKRGRVLKIIEKKHFICSNVKCVTKKMGAESEAVAWIKVKLQAY